MLVVNLLRLLLALILFSLPGPPLTNQTTLGILLESGVAVGVGVEHPQLAIETRFQLSQVGPLDYVMLRLIVC